MVDKRRLEELVNDRNATDSLRGNFLRDPDNPETRTNIGAYVKGYIGRLARENPEDEKLQEMAGGLQNVNLASEGKDVIRKFLDSGHSYSKKILTGHVDRNLGSVLNEIYPGALRELVADGLDPVKGVYERISKLHASYKNSLENLRNANEGRGSERARALRAIQSEFSEFLSVEPFGDALAYAYGASPNFILQFYEGVVKTRRGRFMQVLLGNERSYAGAALPRTEEEVRGDFYVPLATEAVTGELGKQIRASEEAELKAMIARARRGGSK